jgi:ABC-type bacteriocin/lantibiotic exporter with double-glycine peptidase domain
MRLNVPSHRQQEPYTCLPACIKAVLTYHGVLVEEEAVARACQTTPAGTVAGAALNGVRALGCEGALVEEGTMGFLLSSLAEGQPVIVFVDGAQLPYAGGGAHAIVVCGYEAGKVICMDPALGESVELDLLTFLRAWAGLACEGLLVSTAGVTP